MFRQYRNIPEQVFWVILWKPCGTRAAACSGEKSQPEHYRNIPEQICSGAFRFVPVLSEQVSIYN